jgi:hypothetical protein
MPEPRLTSRSACLFSGLALFAAACGGANERGSGEPKNEPPATLDLKQGSFGGVALGDTVQELHRIFGRKAPAPEGEPASALSIGEDQDYGPPVLLYPGEANPIADATYRYERVAFIALRSKIWAIIVNDPDARDRNTDVGVGNKLAAARAGYSLRCGTANEDTEYEPFPACVGRTAPHVWVWFGKDPISNITLARVRPEGL